MSEQTHEPFSTWAVVELMGHRRLAGWVTEQEIAGQAFLRIDVHGTTGSSQVTQFYGAGAVYCLTPTTEAIARAVGAKSMPRPVSRYELEPPKPVTIRRVDDDEEGELGSWADDDEPVQCTCPDDCEAEH